MRLTVTGLPDLPELSPNSEQEQDDVPFQEEPMAPSTIDFVSDMENKPSVPDTNADESFGQLPKLNLQQVDEDILGAENFEQHVTMNEEELNDEIEGMIGGFMRKQKQLAS